MLISPAVLDLSLSLAVVLFFITAKLIFYYSIKNVLPDQPGRSFICGSRQKISIHYGLCRGIQKLERKKEGYYCEEMYNCPINGTVDGCSVNGQD